MNSTPRNRVPLWKQVLAVVSRRTPAWRKTRARELDGPDARPASPGEQPDRRS